MSSEIVELDSQTNEQSEIQSVGFKILIKFCFKNKVRQFTKHPHIVQGESFCWGIKIKNIDVTPTPAAKITTAHIRDLNEKFFQSMEEDEIYVRALNPNEEIYIEIDTATVFLEGMQWAEIEIAPDDKISYFKTYQYEESHKLIKRYYDSDEDKNEWMDSIYIQKKMELLQSKTNTYILLLTILTVWESLFGIKATVKNIFEVLSIALIKISEFIQWCLGFI
jgi:hypothetical protein